MDRWRLMNENLMSKFSFLAKFQIYFSISILIIIQELKIQYQIHSFEKIHHLNEKADLEMLLGDKIDTEDKFTHIEQILTVKGDRQNITGKVIQTMVETYRTAYSI